MERVLTGAGMCGVDTDRSLEQRVRELTLINELTRTLTTTLELPDLLRIVLDRLKTLTQAEALSLLLYDSERDELVFAATETLRENMLIGVHVPPGKGIAGWVARTGRSALVNDAASDPRFYGAIDRASRFDTHSLLAVPLRRRGEGAVVGVIEVANRYDGVVFSPADLEKLEGLADQLGRTPCIGSWLTSLRSFPARRRRCCSTNPTAAN